MNTDQHRLEAAAIALYVSTQPDARTPERWPGIATIWQNNYRKQAAAALAAADKAATITTVEGLDALPIGSVILDNIGLALQLRYDGCWWCTNGDTSVTPEDIDREGLPARVIHFGGTE